MIMIAELKYKKKLADKKFVKNPNGKVMTLFLIITLGPLFSILAYLVISLNLIIFILCLLMFALITSSTISIAYSVLVDVNPPELPATAFSLSNFSALCGRSIGIAVCGTLYRYYFHAYSPIFLIWKIIFLSGLALSLLKPRKTVPLEMDKLAILLRNRLKEEKDKTKEVRVEEKELITIKDILFIVLKNQRELAEKELILAESQRYLTKLLYYSLEVTRRVIKSIDNKKEENFELKHPLEIESKIIEYLKSKVLF